MAKLKIALLSGGVSGEREVSLNTGKMIFNALDKEKYEIFRYDPKDQLKKIFQDAIDRKFDLVFPALHGPFGEDGKLQGMLDMIEMPYIFCGCLASALAMNKYKTKVISRDKGVDSAKDIVLAKNDRYDLDKLIPELNLPIVIKPIELGSSVGISIAKTKAEVEEGIKEAFGHDEEIMLEQFIKGRELTVAVIGDQYNPEALPVIEIIPKASEWFDYKAKYEPGASDEICPAEIPDKVRDEVQYLAKKTYSAVAAKDLARIDFIWDDKADKLYMLEINTIPGMTATSLAPQAAKAAGIEFPDFLDKLIGYNIK